MVSDLQEHKLCSIKISLHQIEIFLTVARSRSISAAAKKLYITQPALSKWLHELEKTLGKELFVRNNRGVALSPEGELLYAKLHDSYHRFRLRIEQIAFESIENIDHILRIGSLHDPEMIDSMGTFLSLYRDVFPGDATTSDLYNFRELREKLLFGDLDLIFTYSGDVVGLDGVEVRELHAISQYFWMPLSWKPGVFEAKKDYKSLEGKTLLLEMRGGRDEAVEICRAHGFEPGRVKYVSSFLLLTHMIKEGDGFTIWGRYMPEVYAERLCRIPALSLEKMPVGSVVAVWRQDDASTKISNAVELLSSPELEAISDDLIEKGVTSHW